MTVKWYPWPKGKKPSKEECMTLTDERRVDPTPERIRQAKGEFEDVNTEPETRHSGYTNTIRMLDGSILDRLASRGSITGDQYHAGARFYRDWYDSGLAASGVVDMQKPIVDNSPKPDPTAKLYAQTSFAQASQALGKIAGHAVTALVLTEETIELYGGRVFRHYKNKKDRVTAVVTALRLGLDILDEHYHGKRHSRYSKSHTTGYRPGIPSQSSRNVGRKPEQRSIRVKVAKP